MTHRGPVEGCTIINRVNGGETRLQGKGGWRGLTTSSLANCFLEKTWLVHLSSHGQNPYTGARSGKCIKVYYYYEPAILAEFSNPRQSLS